MSLPTIIGQDCVSLFNYYRDDAIQQGMSFDGHLFRKLKDFPTAQRGQALEYALKLGSDGQVVITFDYQNTYTVWSDVRMV